MKSRRREGYTITPSSFAQKKLYYCNAAGWYMPGFDFTMKRSFYDYLVLYVVNGEAVVEQRGKTYRIGEGEMMLLNLFEEHSHAPNTEVGCELLWAHIGGGETGALIERVNSGNVRVFSLGEDSAIPKCLKRILQLCKEDPPGLEFRMSSIVHELLMQCSLLYSEPDAQNKSHPILSIINEYIEKHPKERIALQQLAQCVHMSSFHFSRTFKAISGDSPAQYVLKRKIEKSKHMLLYTNATLKEIAVELGFNDPSHYCRTFRNLTNMTPSAFRSNK